MDSIVNLLILIGALVFVLGTAVTLHEFGHFAVGKLLGIRVETFSIGFGPRIFGRRHGTTDYRLSLIPLGGYVKFGGDESNAAIEGASAENIPERERFDLRPRWHKFLVIIAGPVMNILTALGVVFVSALLYGTPQLPSSPTVARVLEGGSAARSGLQPGDRIVEFNGKENPAWDRIKNDAAISPEQDLPLIVERSGQRIPLTVRPLKRMEQGESFGEVDFTVNIGGGSVLVGEVSKSSPAEQAGLQVGERIIAINGESVGSAEDVPNLVKAGQAAPIRLTLERDGVRREVTTNARVDSDGVPRIGVRPAIETPLQPVGLGGAIRYAFNRNIEIIRLTANALGQVFSGKRAARETLSGPIGIGRAAQRAALEGGFAGLIALLGFLSLNLGVINLLPIPVLDGGAITLLFIEWLLGIVGISLSTAVRERIQQVGFVMLILLMGFVITNDIIKEAYNFGAGNAEKPAATSTK